MLSPGVEPRQIGEQRVEVPERPGRQRPLDPLLKLHRAEPTGHVVGLEQIGDPPAVVVAGPDGARGAPARIADARIGEAKYPRDWLVYVLHDLAPSAAADRILTPVQYFVS